MVKDVFEIIWDETETAVDIGGIPTWKRGLDIVCILLALPVIAPLCLLVAFWVKASSPGPVFFRQVRVGYRGVNFLCYKFRSMKVGADVVTHKDHLRHLIRRGIPMTKMDAKGDTRLIPFGAMLRSTGLDELPQLINVLRGEMSLVGPRPCIPYEYEEYLPWQRERFDTLPGLTGLWQVSGKNKTTFSEMVHLDIAYARNKSFWLDLKIVLRTVPALLQQMRDTHVFRKTPLFNKSAIAE